MNTLAKLHLDKELMKESEEKELEEVDVDEVRRSILCIF
jgi:hypothetical protein